MSKEAFKGFVKKHPEVATYVNRGEMSWQKFYEMYDMYGENSIIWDPYRTNSNPSQPSSSRDSAPKEKSSSVKDIVDLVKGMDLATVQKGIDGIQKALGLVQELTVKKAPEVKPYEPRPMYKYFED